MHSKVYNLYFSELWYYTQDNTNNMRSSSYLNPMRFKSTKSVVQFSDFSYTLRAKYFFQKSVISKVFIRF